MVLVGWRLISGHPTDQFSWQVEMASPTRHPSADRLLTIDQAAEILAVNQRMVRRLVESRRVAFVKVGRHVRFRESDLTAAMRAWTIEPTNRTSSRRT